MGLINFLKDPFGYDIFGVEEEDEDTFYGHLYCFGGSPTKQNQTKSSDEISDDHLPSTMLVFGALMVFGVIIMAVVLVLFLALSGVAATCT